MPLHSSATHCLPICLFKSESGPFFPLARSYNISWASSTSAIDSSETTALWRLLPIQLNDFFIQRQIITEVISGYLACRARLEKNDSTSTISADHSTSYLRHFINFNTYFNTTNVKQYSLLNTV